MDRQSFLRLALAGTATGALAGAGLLPRRAAAAPVSAHTLGIRPDHDPRTNRDNLVKALTNSAVWVSFPPGDYRIDNRPEANGGARNVTVENFTGTLEMANGGTDEPPVARLIFIDPLRGGLYLHYRRYSPGARLIGVHATYATAPTVRDDQGCLTFDGATGPTVQRLTLRGSPAGGLVFWGCRTPSVDDVVVSGTMADGVHFANCQDAYGNRIRCRDTGDDGISFVGYDGMDANTGGLLTNSSATSARARGISVIGHSGVTIDHCGVNRSAGPGMLVGADKYGSRPPRDVTIRNCFVYDGGVLGTGTSRSGIVFDNCDELRLHHIDVRNPYDRGLSGSTTGTVRISQVSVTDAGGIGADLARGAFHVTDVDGVPGLAVTGAGQVGLALMGTRLLRYDTMTATDTARASSLHRAFNFTDNPDIRGGTLRVADAKNPATGYIVGAYGGRNSGHLGTIDHSAPYPPAGAPRVQNQSGPAVTYVLA